MRDGIPVIALVTSCVAFFVAVIGILARGGTRARETPEDMLSRAAGQLETAGRERREARRLMTELDRKVTRALEAAPVLTSDAHQDPALERLVKEAVQQELAARLEREAAAAGLELKTTELAAQFEKMVAEATRRLSLRGAKAKALRDVLSGLRGELNAVYTAEKKGKIKPPERDARAKAARKRAEERLKRVLSPTELGKLEKWRSSKDAGPYVRRFFGR